MARKPTYSQLSSSDQFADEESNSNSNGYYSDNYNGNNTHNIDTDKYNNNNNNNNNNDDDDQADEYIRNQKVLMQQQDAGLDLLSQSITRLGEMSTGIAEELGQQNKMLDSMETDLDTAGEDLDIVTRSTRDLIARSGGTSTFCLIAVLSIVVLVLLFLIIYT